MVKKNKQIQQLALLVLFPITEFSAVVFIVKKYRELHSPWPGVVFNHIKCKEFRFMKILLE